MTYDNNDGPIYSILTGKPGSCTSNGDCAGFSGMVYNYVKVASSATSVEPSGPGSLMYVPSGATVSYTYFDFMVENSEEIYGEAAQTACASNPNGCRTFFTWYGVLPQDFAQYDGRIGYAWITVDESYGPFWYTFDQGIGAVCCGGVCKGSC